ncbi:hypothetical protein HPO_03499 [Hyphomonas polymorpha PS728]|uniref:Lipoprotein n=1 Tax=Hyphomonas polymorpha PS728 TaxID=1280954 RepID=A0A062VBV6_9PROT|nr:MULTISPECIES: hypothetical protein [Hyphomonas]AXE63786.1 hypothetical protein BBF93_05800 [Hyphomonas sp. CACIAM 19H1]KCZ99925.1 hypothetical protein HPO_03499 [Hyphomonas polymorpha PS728]
MIRKILLATFAAILALPLAARADVPPPIRVTAKGKEVVPVLVSQPLPQGAQVLSTPVLQVCHGGGGAANAVILSGDPDFDEDDTIETVIVPGQCVFISARLVRLTTNTAGGSTAILVQLVR